MIIFALIIWSIIFCINEGEVPRTTCTYPRPFKSSYSTCASFTEVCLRSEDEDCKSLMSICETACPASNVTVILLREIFNFNHEMNSKLTNQINDMNNKTTNKINILTAKIEKKFAGTITMIVLTFIMCNAFLFYVGWKLGWIKQRNYEPIAGGEEEHHIDNGINAATSASIMNTGAIQQMQQGIAVRFRISDTKEEIEFNVNYRQCLVDVKKQICNLWKATSPHDYKIMELLYNGDPLPNNQYFVPLICLKNDPIECRLDQSVDHNEFVVLHIQGEICVPDSLQMRKTQNIVQLKSLISNFINDEKILVLKKENMVLEDKSTLEDCGISDGDWIKIIKKHMGKIVIRSIFENDPLTVEYSNKDKIFEIIKTATNKFGINPDTFVLYFNEECLEEDKCVWEYGIDSLSPVMFYCLKGLEDVEINKDPSDRGYLSELYHAKDKLDNKMLILKYRDSIENFEKKFLKELISIQLKDSPSEFLKIKGIYKNNNMIHVVIEYMEFGSLTMLLQKEEILEEEIIKWSVQILQCLGNLHRDKLYYMDLKPFELFIDSERKIKFLKFNITTFTKNEREPKIMEKIEKRGDKTVSKIHLAPEIQDGKDGDEKADIWSFGVILINIINGKPPEAHWDDKLDRLHYVLKREISNDLKNLIDSCVQKDPRKRPTIEFLLRNNLFKSYIIPRK